MRTLLSGLGLVESPRWHAGRLWFADWIAGQIIALDSDSDSEARPEVMVEHASLPLCFDFRPDGRGNASVNSPNYDAMGGPPPAGDVAPGFVLLVPPDGTPRVVADDLAFPNGMAVTPDNETLIVAESHRGRLTAFDIGADGSLSARRVWADLGDAAPDGICLDAEGAAWYADVPHRRCVRVRAGGEVAQTVELGRGGFACMLGGPAGTTLFVVAAQWPGMAGITGDAPWHGQVLSLEVDVPGAGWPGPGTVAGAA